MIADFFYFYKFVFFRHHGDHEIDWYENHKMRVGTVRRTWKRTWLLGGKTLFLSTKQRGVVSLSKG